MKNKLFNEFRDKTIGDFEILDPSHSYAVEATRQYMDGLKDHLRTGYGLFIMGPSGVGKTFLANMVLGRAMLEDFRIEAIEFANYVDFHHQMFMFQSQVRAGYDDAVQDVFRLHNRLQDIKLRTDFVLFDDIGREHESGSGWSNEQLFDVFRTRWNRGKPTLFTTNLSMDELTRRYTPGFTSLLYKATRIILVEGEDYRCVKGS